MIPSSKSRSPSAALRCDVCGRFISYAAMDSGAARRRMVTPDAEGSREDYETLCEDDAKAGA